MGEVGLEHVSKVYTKGTYAVTDLNLEIADGEFLVMVGPSGCGKTTALRMVAGLESVTEGIVRVGGRIVNNVKPKARDVAMVFQDYALYPQMTVYDNMAFGLRVRKTPRKEIDRTVREAAGVLGLERMLDRRPGELSGGQRQRVAMGRAITRHPVAFLMDEPLSNLDAQLRVQMRAEIARIQKELRVTTLYVTHDQVEAVTLGDRVAVLRDGALEQVAPPKVLYEAPTSVFVASFIGSPPMNLLHGSLDFGTDVVWLMLGSTRVRLDDRLIATRLEGARGIDSDVLVGIRPEDLLDCADEPSIPEDQRLRVEVSLVEDLGSELLVHFGLDAPAAIPSGQGGAASVLDVGRTHCVAKFGRTSHVRAKDIVDIAVDTSRLHFFDHDTGITLAGAAARTIPVHA